MKFKSDPVSDEFAHDRTPLPLGVLLNRKTDIADGVAGANLFPSEPQALPGDIYDLSGTRPRRTDEKSLVRVGKITVEYGGDIDVEDVAFPQLAFSRNAVANHFVNGDTNALRKSAIIQRRGYAAVFNGVFVDQRINDFGDETRTNRSFHQIERFKNQSPGDPDASILVYRMETSDPGEAMPELGRGVVHEEGVALVREWIAAMRGGCRSDVAGQSDEKAS